MKLLIKGLTYFYMGKTKCARARPVCPGTSTSTLVQTPEGPLFSPSLLPLTALLRRAVKCSHLWGGKQPLLNRSLGREVRSIVSKWKSRGILGGLNRAANKGINPSRAGVSHEVLQLGSGRTSEGWTKPVFWWPSVGLQINGGFPLSAVGPG